MKPPKTWADQIEELVLAFNDLVLVFAEETGIIKLLDWLVKKLGR